MDNLPSYSVRRYDVLNCNAPMDCSSFAEALIDVGGDISEHTFIINYCRRDALSDDSPDIAKVRLIKPQLARPHMVALICGIKLVDLGVLNADTDFRLGSFGPRAYGLYHFFGGSSHNDKEQRAFSLNVENELFALDDTRFAEQLTEIIQSQADDEKTFSETWYLANILCLYFSGGYAKPNYALTMGMMFAELSAKTSHEESILANKQR